MKSTPYTAYDYMHSVPKVGCLWLAREEDWTRYVVHCKKEPFDIYIGRPSKWGNPFSHLSDTLADFKVSSREAAIEAYENWILQQADLLADLPELKGKILGCWCSPKACHGEVLVRLANMEAVA